METETLATPAASPYAARILPPAEWDRLPGDVVGTLHPDHAVVIVVEDLDGAIVARWVAMNTVHMEGLFCEPSHRGNPVVAARLVRLMVGALHELGVAAVVTIIQDEPVRALAEHFGFETIPGTIHQLRLES